MKRRRPMTFLNKVGNPFVRAFLRSPLHGLMSAGVLLLTYQGRKTGRTYQMPVQYVRDGKEVFLLPSSPERKTWWRNLRGGAPVEVWLQGESRPAIATLIDPGRDWDDMLRGFSLYLDRFPMLDRRYGIVRDPSGRPSPSSLEAAAHKILLVKLTLDDRWAEPGQ